MRFYILDLSGLPATNPNFATKLVATFVIDTDLNRGLNRDWPEVRSYRNGFALLWWNDNASDTRRLRGALLYWPDGNPVNQPNRRDLSFDIEIFDQLSQKSHPSAQFGHPHDMTITECPTMAVVEGRAFAQNKM